ncbi:MAG TPA: hypothetical protein VFA10_15950 [Ktedonobacteraceae bacterium]|nr:hypothetical protein [Ktedonobacteraceae bacterium]
MLQELSDTLKAEWEKLHTATNDWIAQLEGKYSKGTDAETKTVKESISNKKFVLTSTQQSLQQANPTTHAGIRELAGKAQTYLDLTGPIHQSLTQRSAGDAKIEEAATTVQKHRDALSNHVQAIYSSTMVHGTSPTIPLIAGGSTIVGAAPAGHESSVPGFFSSSGSTGVANAASALSIAQVLSRDSSPPLFLVLLKKQQHIDPDIITHTKSLFNHERPQLTDPEILALVDAWTNVVKEAFSSLSEQTPSLFGQQLDSIDAIIGLATLHAEIETLYSELTTNVERTSQDSLDSLLFSLY